MSGVQQMYHKEKIVHHNAEGEWYIIFQSGAFAVHHKSIVV